MMNLSELLTSIKMDLGIYGVSLPYDDPEKTLFDVIKLRTIKTFSQFYPFVMRVDLDMNQLRCLKSNYQESIYELPDIFGDRKLLSIRKVIPVNRLLGNGYMSPIFDDSLDLYNSMMMGQAAANLLSAATPPFTFKFEQPNLMYLYNMSTMANQITVEFCLEHYENLASIPNTAWESFYELALLDIKRLLYGALKHYRELQTAHGTISLQIDDWANAESERKELIEHWRDVYHMEADQFVVI